MVKELVLVWSSLALQSGLHGFGNIDVQGSFEVFVEFSDLGRNRLFGFVLTGEHVRRLKPITGDAEDSCFVGQDTILPIEFAVAADGHAAGRFRENTFGFRQQLDRFYDLWIGDVFVLTIST